MNLTQSKTGKSIQEKPLEIWCVVMTDNSLDYQKMYIKPKSNEKQLFFEENIGGRVRILPSELDKNVAKKGFDGEVIYSKDLFATLTKMLDFRERKLKEYKNAVIQEGIRIEYVKKRIGEIKKELEV